MSVLKNIPVILDPEKVKKALHLDKEKPSFVDTAELLEDAKALIQSQALYEDCFITKKGEESVEIEGVSFSSRLLRKNLDRTERVFPYVITIGKKLENKASFCGDLLRQFYLENIGDMALRESKQYLVKIIEKQYGAEKLSSMSPGSLKYWPITEQKPLFSLFRKKQEQIGVRLTDKMLMIPRKSISGILFPTKAPFYSCLYCPRERCSARTVPYNEKQSKALD